MADTHAGDPGAAPTHYDVRERFATYNYVLAVLLGLAAVAAGIALGLVLVND